MSVIGENPCDGNMVGVYLTYPLLCMFTNCGDAQQTSVHTLNVSTKKISNTPTIKYIFYIAN